MFVDEGLGDPVAHGISFGACILTPKSCGSVTLRSNDPSAKPWIRHNFLAEEEDVHVMLDGLRLTADIARAPALKRYCRDGSVWERQYLAFLGVVSFKQASSLGHFPVDLVVIQALQ